MKVRYLYLLLFVVFLSVAGHAQQWDGSESADWSDPDNWSSPASVPTASGNVTIPSTAPNWPELPGAISINSLTMNAGSQLDVKGAGITVAGAVNITGATVSNSGSGSIVIEVGGGNSYLRNSVFGAALELTTTGDAALYEADATGANTYNGDVKFKIESTGTHYFSSGFRSLFKGNLALERTIGGTTHVFTSNAATSTGVKGNFSYTDTGEGTTVIGGGAEKTIIEGKLDISMDATGSGPSFTLQYLENQVTGGVVSLVNPGVLTVTNNTLLLAGFDVTGKSGGGVADFDQNVITTANGLSYTDDETNIYQFQISRCEITGPASFTSRGIAAIYDAYSGRGPNTFHGNVVFTADGTGPLYINWYYKSVYNADLTITRNGAGETDLFRSAGEHTIARDLTYINYAGGNTNIGQGSGTDKTIVNGKINIEAEFTDSTPFFFRLGRLDNSAGAGGEISIAGPGELVVNRDTLKLERFEITGKNGGGNADFDQNVIITTAGLSYEDAAANSYPLLFSRTEVTGPAGFTSKGSAAIYDAFSGRGPNTFHGNVAFTADASGPLYLSYYYKSAYNADLTVIRNAAGETDLFHAAGEHTIVGDLNYTNHAGGNTNIGQGGIDKTIVNGKINIDAAFTDSNPAFRLGRLDNIGGTGGEILIAGPGELVVNRDTLKLERFEVTGKNGGGNADFDQNVIITTAGLSYEDAAANSYPLLFSRTEVIGPASFTLKGGAAIYDAFSGRGPNTFHGNVAFTADASGPLYLSYYYKSAYNADLTVTRNAAGETDLFYAAGEHTIAGDFNYTNYAGGNTNIGQGGIDKTIVSGKVNLYAAFTGSNPAFRLARLDNIGGAGGQISIAGPGELMVYRDTLKLEYFTVTGKNGGGNSDFDQNVIITTAGLSYEDAAANSYPLLFSRTEVTGPASFTSKGGAAFSDTFSGRGSNQFNGDVVYSREGTGSIHIGHYFQTSYAAGLTFASAEGITVYAGRLRFNGATNGAFVHTGVAEPVLPGFIIEKTGSARLILSSPLRTSNTVDFVSGYVQSSALNPLIFQAGTGYTGAGNGSHVVGPVHKIGNTAFTFPTGTGQKFFTAGISAPSDIADCFSAEYSGNNPGDDDYDPDSKAGTLTKVFDEGYWDIRRVNGTSNVTVTLGYNVPAGYVTDPSSLSVAHWNGAQWDDLGNDGSPVGNNTVGTITTVAAVAAFSPFTIASRNEANTLPVKLAGFLAARENHSAILHWITTEEINSDRFEIEHSGEGASWLKIGEVAAVKRSAAVRNYNYIHANPADGINYYRLKMIDSDGRYEYSQIRSLDFGGDNLVEIYPNPAADRLFLLPGEAGKIKKVEVFTVSGTLLLSKEAPAPAEGLDVSGLPGGLYLVRVGFFSGQTEARKLLISR